MSKSDKSETPEPWAPEGASRVGLPPRAGREGERGTSAHAADLKASDERGPGHGRGYFEDNPGYVELGTGATEHAREDASKA